jgi:hypothetical protein
MIRWREFRAALAGLVTAIRAALAYWLVTVAMDLHPGLAGEMAEIALTAAKVLPTTAKPGEAE